MASDLYPLMYNGKDKVVLTEWKVKQNGVVNQNPFVLFLYQICNNDGTPQESVQKYKVNNIGVTVRHLYKNKGDVIKFDDVLLDYEPCSHPTLMKDLCAICGVNINNFDSHEKRKIAENTSVSMVHSIPELRVSKKVAEDLGKADEDRLLKARKLVLLVDLDQTIVHSSNQDVPIDIPDIHHYQLYGANSPWYHTKFRPFMLEFLEEISKYFELHICTFGARRYAHQISHLIDPKCKFFPKDRILSRDEFFDPRSKTGNMKSLFPCGDSMVCIIDDRVDVWNYLPNVVHVKPYICFKTDDINAPEKLNIGFKNFKNSNISGNSSKLYNNESTSKEDDELLKTIETENIDNIKIEESDKQSEKSDIENVNSKELIDNNDSAKETDADKIKTEIEESPKGQIVETLKAEIEESPKAQIEETPKSEVCKNETEKSETVIKISEDIKKQILSDNLTKKSTEHDNLLDDKDDYLLYLKDILIRIHKEFYREYDEKVRYQSEGEEILIPDVKRIIPCCRKSVLHGVNVVFSGVIATNTPPEANRYYRLAQSLGAIITNDIIVKGSPITTHLVVSKWGTVKVNSCIKFPNIKMVTPDWLITCAERWEKVDEELFKLNKDTVYNMNDRDDCRKVFIPYYVPTGHKSKDSQPQPIDEPSTSTSLSNADTLETDESKTMLDLSPLSSFSMTDLSEMGKEVDDACSDGDIDTADSSDESDLDEDGNKMPKNKRRDLDEDDECMNYENEGEYPQGWKNTSKRNRGVKRSKDDSDEEDNDQSESDDNLTSSTDDESVESFGEEAAALERQFSGEFQQNE